MRVCILCENDNVIRFESYIGIQGLLNINVSQTGELPATHKLSVIALTDDKAKDFFKFSDLAIIENSNRTEFLLKHGLKIIKKISNEEKIPELGRIEKKDNRDLNYLITSRIPSVQKPTSLRVRYWNDDEWWGDQKNTPQCVGYAWAHWIEDAPVTHGGVAPIISPVTIYKEAQKIDEWAGENYDGTSVRAGAKYLKNTGKISSYLWAFNLTTLINTVLNIGPVVVGTNWYYGMFFPDRSGLIRLSGRLCGGHAYVINGIDINKKQFRIKNSWGKNWGHQGRAFISFANMERLIRERGEICLAVENKS
jgi:hypothetical protein